MKKPLPTWLYQILDNWGCAPFEGAFTWKGLELHGWYLPTSTSLKIFLISEEDRSKAEAKYLSPSGAGLQPALFLANRGLSSLDMTPEVLAELTKNGLALTEGWKGAAALCASGFNSCTIGGCSSGVATLAFHLQYVIEMKLAKVQSFGFDNKAEIEISIPIDEKKNFDILK